jgi:flagellar biosynthesis/type III secretory pathway chaperone
MNYVALYDVLRQQAAVLVKMKHLLDKRRLSLVGGNLQQLNELECEEVLLHQQMQFLEEKRTGLCPAGKTLSAIIDISTTTDYKTKLTVELGNLRRLAAQVQEANTLNKMLLEQSLSYAQAMQRALWPGSDAFYGCGGELRLESLLQAPHARLLDETA